MTAPSFREAQELLTEIMAIAMDRMNNGADVTPWEAHTLGKISGVCARYPGVVEALKAQEERSQHG